MIGANFCCLERQIVTISQPYCVPRAGSKPNLRIRPLLYWATVEGLLVRSETLVVSTVDNAVVVAIGI